MKEKSQLGFDIAELAGLYAEAVGNIPAAEALERIAQALRDQAKKDMQ